MRISVTITMGSRQGTGWEEIDAVKALRHLSLLEENPDASDVVDLWSESLRQAILELAREA